MKFSTFGPGPETGSVATAALARGHVRDDTNPDVVYIRTRTYPPWRDAGLELIASLHARWIPTLPSYEDSLRYDDKRAQATALQPWLPPTAVLLTEAEARDAVAIVDIQSRDAGPWPRWPLVSKSSRGAGSKNVRLIRTREEAEAEIRAAFGDGIKAHRELQRGYLIWQEFIEGNDHDIRVVINGDHLYGLVRYNRSEEVPFASGSGKLRIIRDLDAMEWDGERINTAKKLRQAFEMAREISAALNTRWACYDFVFRGERCYVLEVSFSWVEGAYAECPCFDVATLEPNGHTAAEWATFAVEEMERMVSNG